MEARVDIKATPSSLNSTMPVTVRPASHPSRAAVGQGIGPSADVLFSSSCPREFQKAKQVVQTSFADLPSAGADADADDATGPVVFASNNGLVHAAWDAYAHHNHLRIRPEDVWFSILTQFSFYVNAHAEELRSHFVAHEGKKQLEVQAEGTIRTVDFGKLAVKMTEEIDKNVVDPELRDWILPDFTTTDKKRDTITAAVLMMGTMQAYFSYRMAAVCCGIPSVTLLGEREDWAKIRRRVEKLPNFGREPEAWAALLSPVLDMFVRCFDEPESPAVTDFWARVAQHEAGSGFSDLTGWITAFCFWTAEGVCKSRSVGQEEEIVVRSFAETKFLRIDADNIPDAFVSVPVEVIETDGVVVLHKYATKMVAGSVGIQATSSGELLDESVGHEGGFRLVKGNFVPFKITPAVGQKVGRDTLQPLTGWWMYELKPEHEKEAAQAEPPKGLAGYTPW